MEIARGGGKFAPRGRKVGRGGWQVGYATGAGVAKLVL